MKKWAGAFLFFAAFWVAYASPAAAQETWTASGCCNFTCTGGSTSGCGSESFLSGTACNSRLAQGLAICGDYAPATCTPSGFSVTWTCTCTSGCAGGGGLGGGGSASDFFNNPEILQTYPDFAGSQPTSGQGGLAQDLGTTNRLGSEQGKATFTPHASYANAGWIREASWRIGSRPGFWGGGSRPRTRDGWFQQSAGRVGAFLTAWLPRGPKTEPMPAFTTLDYPGATTAGYQQTFINEIQPGGEPITGAGVSVGPPETPPPPSPETPLVPQLTGRVQSGATACRGGPGWFFNSQTQMCYPSNNSCQAACQGRQNCVCSP